MLNQISTEAESVFSLLEELKSDDGKTKTKLQQKILK